MQLKKKPKKNKNKQPKTLCKCSFKLYYQCKQKKNQVSFKVVWQGTGWKIEIITVLPVTFEQHIFTTRFFYAKIYLFSCIFSIFYIICFIIKLNFLGTRFKQFSVFGGPYFKNGGTDFYFLCRFWKLLKSSKTNIRTIQLSIMHFVLSKKLIKLTFLEKTKNLRDRFFYCSNVSFRAFKELSESAKKIKICPTVF